MRSPTAPPLGGVFVCAQMNDKPTKPQLDKFRDLARELEADEDEAAFEERVRRIAQSQPPKPEKPASED